MKQAAAAHLLHRRFGAPLVRLVQLVGSSSWHSTRSTRSSTWSRSRTLDDLSYLPGAGDHSAAIEEHLYATGFEPQRTIPRYLPYSFRGILPPSPALTRNYLRMPFAWKLLGKQFLVIGRKD